MDNARRDALSRLLVAGAKELDLTPSQHARAVKHYEAVGEYLGKRESPIAQFSPLVFAQGSMVIGTATKPVGRDEFDLDLMCRLLIQSQNDPAVVKQLVGKRLRSHKTYRKMLREKNRCWRLVYTGEFHMDIIPGIPDSHGQAATALLVPDKELRCWKETDPDGYANWFFGRATLATYSKVDVRAEVEAAPPAPDDGAKLPLQVVVQLLKRHRDLMFADDKDAPISIIITTLAAHAYDGTHSTSAALSGVLERMPSHVRRTATGTAVVANPVNPHENFADKWATHPCREKRFFSWIDRARRDLRSLETARLPNIQAPLGDWVGKRAANHTVTAFGDKLYWLRRFRNLGLSDQAASSSSTRYSLGVRQSSARWGRS